MLLGPLSASGQLLLASSSLGRDIQLNVLGGLHTETWLTVSSDSIENTQSKKRISGELERRVKELCKELFS